MIDAPSYEIFTHSFSFSLRQTHKREICCQQTNRQNFAKIFTTGWFESSGLFHLPLSFSPETNVKVTAMAMSPVCGFARDNLSQRLGRDIGAPWRLQQEIHGPGGSIFLVLSYTYLHVLHTIFSKNMHFRITIF